MLNSKPRRGSACTLFQRRNIQGCTSDRCQIPRATKFRTVAPTTCGCSEWNLPHFITLALRVFRRQLTFDKFLRPCHCLYFGVAGSQRNARILFQSTIGLHRRSLSSGCSMALGYDISLSGCYERCQLFSFPV